ncbi:carbonic anhydrase [Candidatus Micrarchaeota archaeon]|nr:carbonic anhydrase [Candidatus Micrarchaeota archaeon]
MVMNDSMKSKTASGAQDARVAPRRPQAETVVKGGPMNAEQVLNRLMEGNKRYMEGELGQKDVKGKRESSLQGQKPFATVVACSDSRVEPVYVFDCNIEELFCIQTAGNILDDIARETIEYAVAHLHTPVVMILGHSRCGAVTAVYQGAAQKELPSIAAKIEPAISNVERTGDEDKDVVNCATANAKAVMKELMGKSEIVRNAVEKGETKLVGAMYHLEDGRVDVLQ